MEGFIYVEKKVIKQSEGLPPELEGYLNEYLKSNSVKNMNDIQEMMRNWFGPIM